MYFDNAATSLIKPACLAGAYEEIIRSGKYGNPSRSGHLKSQNTMLAILESRKAIADLFHIDNPMDVAFCQNATFGLNFLIKSLVNPEDHVITSLSDHNSVLRPLYLSGCQLSFMDIGKDLEVSYSDLEKYLQKNTRFVITNHASNLLANLNDLDRIHAFCKEHNLIMIIDMAQTAGSMDIDLSKYDRSLFVMTGHKSLYGPSGAGFIIKNGDFDFKTVFCGGSGTNSFSKEGPSTFPAIFEVGTSNYMDQIAIKSSIDFLKKEGLDKIHGKLIGLSQKFYDGIKDIVGMKIYSKRPTLHNSTALVSFNLGKINSSDLALELEEDYGIEVRPGAHCAPLIHKKFGTVDQGMVRFSFSYFNSFEEVEASIGFIRRIAANAKE